MGPQEVTQALPGVLDTFSPLFFADHVTAIAGWLGFYALEAVAIAAVLRTYANDADAAVRAGGRRRQ